MKAAFIGRFQPLHLGHQKVIEECSSEHEACIVIGSAEKSREKENPLTVEERKTLINECFPDLPVFLLPDNPSDETWCKNLEQKTDCEAVITQNKETENAVKENSDLEIIHQEFHQRDMYSGTEVRRRIRSGAEWRYLVPECGKQKLEELLPVIKKTGRDYEFTPGWKKENIQN